MEVGRPVEFEAFAHYAHLVAQLTVAAARTDDAEMLARIADELEESFLDVWALTLRDPDTCTLR